MFDARMNQFILYSRWRDMRLRKTTAKPFGLSLDHPDTTAWFLRQKQLKRFNLLAFFWPLILCTSWTFSACISILASFSTSGKFTGFSGWKIQTFACETVDKIWKHDQNIEVLYLSGPQRTQLDNGDSWFDTTKLVSNLVGTECVPFSHFLHIAPPWAVTLWEPFHALAASYRPRFPVRDTRLENSKVPFVYSSGPRTLGLLHSGFQTFFLYVHMLYP